MGFLFWFVLFFLMGALISKVKNSWSKGKYFQSIIWVIISIVIFSIFSIYREATIQEKRNEWHKEFQKSTKQTTEPSEVCRSFFSFKVSSVQQI